VRLDEDVPDTAVGKQLLPAGPRRYEKALAVITRSTTTPWRTKNISAQARNPAQVRACSSSWISE
jgi:hypothetical protein